MSIIEILSTPLFKLSVAFEIVIVYEDANYHATNHIYHACELSELRELFALSQKYQNAPVLHVAFDPNARITTIVLEEA